MKKANFIGDVLGQRKLKHREETKQALIINNGCIVGTAETLGMGIEGTRQRINRYRLNSYIVADSYTQQRPYKPALLRHEDVWTLGEEGLMD